MDKIRTTVRVAGKEYTIASYDAPEHVQRVAQYVNRKMNELSLQTHLPAAQLAVLAAMNATDDLIKSQEELRHMRAQLQDLQDRMQEGERV